MSLPLFGALYLFIKIPFVNFFKMLHLNVIHNYVSDNSLYLMSQKNEVLSQPGPFLDLALSKCSIKLGLMREISRERKERLVLTLPTQDM